MGPGGRGTGFVEGSVVEPPVVRTGHRERRVRSPKHFLLEEGSLQGKPATGLGGLGAEHGLLSGWDSAELALWSGITARVSLSVKLRWDQKLPTRRAASLLPLRLGMAFGWERVIMVCVPSLAPTPVPSGPVHAWDRCVLILRMLWGGVGAHGVTSRTPQRCTQPRPLPTIPTTSVSSLQSWETGILSSGLCRWGQG
ncbi:hypothetical protein H8959_004208 [Pygathrix nigripes]